MLFRGRTVLAFIIVALLASCMMTFMMIGPKGFLLDMMDESQEGS